MGDNSKKNKDLEDTMALSSEGVNQNQDCWNQGLASF
jgi:hypothetical protein